ncbi:phospholipase D family protein [Comamonas sp. w2-DMI]|uniref:phospholipase D family nuclease n=1 Tax=Comamonas sp. w2-DMI TaxID=3126391 RepID=UPI0032E51D1C
MTTSFLQQQLVNTLHTLKHRTTKLAAVLTLIYVGSGHAVGMDYSGLMHGAVKAAQSITSSSISSSGTAAAAPGEVGKIEVAFSPNEGALPLVLKVINSSSKSLDLMAYSFTSADVTRAVLAAQKRGVRVRVVADQKQNSTGQGGQYAQAALSALANAGADVRLVEDYPIFHDKVIISDRTTVQTGSFNYSKAAAHSNSENVLVLWGATSVASQYQEHFDSRWRIAKRFTPR